MTLLGGWWRYQRGDLTLRQFRVLLALHELQARRCTLKDPKRRPKYGPEELRGLVGGTGGALLRRDVARLGELGLAEVTARSISFPNTHGLGNEEQAEFEAFLALTENHRRTIPLPRRVLRYLAGCSKKVLLGTALGHLLRCVYLRGQTVASRGRCKASWTAEVFGLDVRSVKRARRTLLEVGLLERAVPDPTPREQVFENRWGRAFFWNLNWAGPSNPVSTVAEVASPTGQGGGGELPAAQVGTELLDEVPGAEVHDTQMPPLSGLSTAQLPPPESDQEPLQEYKNQKPAQGRPSGGETRGRKDPRRSAPRIVDIQRIDLEQGSRLLELFGDAVRRQLVIDSEAGKLNFFALAEHALRYGDEPPRLFRSLLEKRRWSFITLDDEDAARRKLHEVLFPDDEDVGEAQPRTPRSGQVSTSPPHPDLAPPPEAPDRETMRQLIAASLASVAPGNRKPVTETAALTSHQARGERRVCSPDEARAKAVLEVLRGA